MKKKKSCPKLAEMTRKLVKIVFVRVNLPNTQNCIADLPKLRIRKQKKELQVINIENHNMTLLMYFIPIQYACYVGFIVLLLEIMEDISQICPILQTFIQFSNPSLVPWVPRDHGFCDPVLQSPQNVRISGSRILRKGFGSEEGLGKIVHFDQLFD